MAETLNIGGVRYLNARPLVYGLEKEPGVNLRLEYPRALSPLLRSGEVDAALLPAIEYFRLAAEGTERAKAHRPDVPEGSAARVRAAFLALPVAAIGSRGAVGSVRLFGYTEQDRVRRVLLDSASRTSNALARVIAIRRLGISPHFVLPEEAAQAPPRQADAELVMGDPGLVAARPKAKWVLDLGMEWERLTHLPFIYAFWVVRADGPLASLSALLAAARDRGLAAREEIVALSPGEFGVPVDVARRHIFEQVQYTFGQRDRDGLRAFYRMAAEEGLAPDGVRLQMAREDQ
jgi:predicted solute-binding protein